MEKKEIKISVSTLIILVIALILLVAVVIMGIHIANQNKVLEASQLDMENKEQEIQQNQVIKSTPTKVQQNKATELNIDDNIVKKLLGKIKFETAVTASIYKIGSFTRDTIPNDLILKMGFINFDYENRTAWSNREVDGNGISKEKITGAQMKKSIQNIFGKNIKYTNTDFNLIEVPTFDNFTIYKYVISYIEKEDAYLTNQIENGGYASAHIIENVEKVLKYDDKIEIYVQTGFVDPEEEIVLYKDFDFKSETFKNEIAREELNNNGTIENIDNYKNKLDTYVYTFELDSTDGEYYLSAFNKV